MLTKRIIPCLDIKDGKTVKGVNFVNLIDAGDPVELAAVYASQGADELVFLDITATVEARKTLAELVNNIAKAINIPFTVGGGISTIADVDILLHAGADKISINSAAVHHPTLITQLAKNFGSQCIVVAVDTRYHEDWMVYIKGGREATTLKTIEWVKRIEELGGGEILLTSMNHDGTKDGFAIELNKSVAEAVNIPVIASGGAGNITHFEDIFLHTNVDAALAASIFHFGEVNIPNLKSHLKSLQIPVRL